jgi:hypothetical protein
MSHVPYIDTIIVDNTYLIPLTSIVVLWTPWRWEYNVDMSTKIKNTVPYLIAKCAPPDERKPLIRLCTAEI